jgi:ATP-dependent DNA helicase RecQ
LGEIKNYCSENDIEEKEKGSYREKSDKNRRYMIVGEMYNAGESIESLSERYHVQASTIVNHLARFAAAGNPLKNGNGLQSQTSLPVQTQEKIIAAFEALGTDFLKPVFEKLDGEISYEELKVMRLIAMSENR